MIWFILFFYLGDSGSSKQPTQSRSERASNISYLFTQLHSCHSNNFFNVQNLQVFTAKLFTSINVIKTNSQTNVNICLRLVFRSKTPNTLLLLQCGKWWPTVCVWCVFVCVCVMTCFLSGGVGVGKRRGDNSWEGYFKSNLTHPLKNTHTHSLCPVLVFLCPRHTCANTHSSFSHIWQTNTHTHTQIQQTETF